MEGCKINNDKDIGHKGPFEIYALCDGSITGLGNALVDTGFQVSLVKEGTLIRGSHIKYDVSRIQGIIGDFMEIKGQTKLIIGETSPHNILVLEKLPMNYDMLLGQDWLERFTFDFQIPSLGINLPAYSKTLVRIATREKGNRIVEAQELQENLFCGSSVVDCVDNAFLRLLINLNHTE